MSEENDLKGAQAMADAMAHVLAKKRKKNGASILSRSKSTMELLAKEKQERKEKKVQTTCFLLTNKIEKLQKKEMIDACHILPDAYSMELEKKLVKVATRGSMSSIILLIASCCTLQCCPEATNRRRRRCFKEGERSRASYVKIFLFEYAQREREGVCS